MDREKQLVVVLTRSFATGVGVVRSLGAAGYLVDVVASARMPGLAGFVAKSRYVREFREVISPKFHADDETDENLLGALLEYRDRYEDKPVLFPTDDYTASIMDENREALSEIFRMPGIVGGKSGDMIRSMDKNFQSELAREAGILVPQEWIVPLYGGSLVIPEDVVFPCFVKPTESITGYKSEMKVCKNRKELRAHLMKLRNKRPNRTVLIQEYLKIKQEIDLSGVCIDQEIIIPAIIKKTCVAKHEKGVTLSGMLYPLESMGDYAEKICDMMRRFHYTGMFDMEFNVTENGIYFNEVNLRSGGPNYAYFKSGANLPALWVDEIVSGTHKPEDASVDRVGQNFIYEKVAWEDYLHGFMSKETLDRRLADADFGLLYSEEDPGPYQDKLQEFNETLRNRDLAAKKAARQKKIKNSKIMRWWRRMKRKIRRSRLARWWRKRKKEKERKQRIERRHQQLVRDEYPQLKEENKRKRYNGRPRVMVAGRNYCSNLSIARSLGEAGYEVEVMHVYQTLPGPNEPLRGIEADRYSKYVKAYYIVVTKRADKTLLEELIKKADKRHKMLLIPADDLVASVADQFYNRLKKYYLLPNVADTQGEINRLMTKGVQKELARAAGLPIVEGCVIEAERGKFTIPDSVRYPCFIKPDVSRLAAKSRMHRCENREELEGWLTVFSERRKIAMVVEDCVDIAREYSILGVSTKNGAIGPAAFVAVQGGSQEHRGVALTGRILDLEEMQPLADKLIDFVGSLQYDGLYDIDLIETTDGKMYFVEINMRLGASGYAFNHYGVNLAGIFADYMIYQKPVDPSLRISRAGGIFASEKVLIDEYAGGRIEKEDYEKILQESDVFFIKNEDDPRAYEYFKDFFAVADRLRGRQTDTVPLAQQSLEERLGTVKQRALNNVTKKTFWSEKKATAMMDAARQEHGVSWVEYEARSLYRIPADELGDYLQEQEMIRQQRERAIASVMEKTGWPRKRAVARMQSARKKNGATFILYDQLNLWRLPEEKQKRYLRCVQRTGCSEAEYYRYRIGGRKLQLQNNLFLNTHSNQIVSRWNTDETFVQKLSDPEQFFRLFRQFTRRAWCVNTKITRQRFAETFEGAEQILYRPLASENTNIYLISLDAGNMTAAYEKLATLDPGIVEECLVQHPDLEALSPGAMAKIRIVTVSNRAQAVTAEGDHYSVAYAVLRTGGEDGQDHQYYQGSLYAAIDPETGIVLTDAADGDCRRYQAHPVSGTAYKDFAVPMFAEAMELVQNAALRCRIDGYLGWDLVITDRRPVLVSVTAQPAPVLISAPWILERQGVKEKMMRYLWVEEEDMAKQETERSETA